LKCLFSTTPEVKKETEANGGHRGDRTLHRTWLRCDRTRLVISACLGFVTGRWSALTSASGQFICAQKKKARDRRVRSLKEPACPVSQGTGASGHVSRGAERSRVMIGHEARPVTHDRMRPIVEGAYWTLTGHWHCRVRSSQGARPVMSLRARYYAIGASGHDSGASGRCEGHVRSLPGARPVIWFDRWHSDRWRIRHGRARLVSYYRRVRSSRKRPSEE
jgi:hypothetical protein